MHELSIAQNIIQQIDSYFQDKDIKDKLKKIFLRVGKLTSIVPQNLSFCFEILTADTVFKGVQLEIEEVPIQCKCQQCLSTFEPGDEGFHCPHCSSSEVMLLTGRELMIESVEVE